MSYRSYSSRRSRPQGPRVESQYQSRRRERERYDRYDRYFPRPTPPKLPREMETIEDKVAQEERRRTASLVRSKLQSLTKEDKNESMKQLLCEEAKKAKSVPAQIHSTEKEKEQKRIAHVRKPFNRTNGTPSPSRRRTSISHSEFQKETLTVVAEDNIKSKLLKDLLTLPVTVLKGIVSKSQSQGYNLCLSLLQKECRVSLSDALRKVAEHKLYDKGLNTNGPMLNELENLVDSDLAVDVCNMPAETLRVLGDILKLDLDGDAFFQTVCEPPENRQSEDLLLANHQLECSLPTGCQLENSIPVVLNIKQELPMNSDDLVEEPAPCELPSEPPQSLISTENVACPVNIKQELGLTNIPNPTVTDLISELSNIKKENPHALISNQTSGSCVDVWQPSNDHQNADKNRANYNANQQLTVPTTSPRNDLSATQRSVIINNPSNEPSISIQLAVDKHSNRRPVQSPNLTTNENERRVLDSGLGNKSPIGLLSIVPIQKLIMYSTCEPSLLIQHGVNINDNCVTEDCGSTTTKQKPNKKRGSELQVVDLEGASRNAKHTASKEQVSHSLKVPDNISSNKDDDAALTSKKFTNKKVKKNSTISVTEKNQVECVHDEPARGLGNVCRNNEKPLERNKRDIASEASENKRVKRNVNTNETKIVNNEETYPFSHRRTLPIGDNIIKAANDLLENDIRQQGFAITRIGSDKRTKQTPADKKLKRRAAEINDEVASADSMIESIDLTVRKPKKGKKIKEIPAVDNELLEKSKKKKRSVESNSRDEIGQEYRENVPVTVQVAKKKKLKRIENPTNVSSDDVILNTTVKPLKKKSKNQLKGGTNQYDNANITQSIPPSPVNGFAFENDGGRSAVNISEEYQNFVRDVKSLGTGTSFRRRLTNHTVQILESWFENLATFATPNIFETDSCSRLNSMEADIRSLTESRFQSRQLSHSNYDPPINDTSRPPSADNASMSSGHHSERLDYIPFSQSHLMDNNSSPSVNRRGNSNKFRGRAKWRNRGGYSNGRRNNSFSQSGNYRNRFDS